MGAAVERVFAAVPQRARLGHASALRILAYHGVPDPVSFDHHLRIIEDQFYAVGLDDVLRWRQGASLPAGAVWITFDDGRQDVITNAMPLLVRRGLPATMFVCPGVIDTQTAFWWDGLQPDAATALKRLPDDQRRRIVAQRPPLNAPQLTSDQLRSWSSAGFSVGNHTWDHPCLDTCSPEAQRRQIRQAHEWLVDHVGEQATTAFAYPNGNETLEARAALIELDYQVAVLFDHALASAQQHALALSRLRIDADVSPHRAGAILSGWHSGALRLKGRLYG